MFALRSKGRCRTRCGSCGLTEFGAVLDLDEAQRLAHGLVVGAVVQALTRGSLVEIAEAAVAPSAVPFGHLADPVELTTEGIEKVVARIWHNAANFSRGDLVRVILRGGGFTTGGPTRNSTSAPGRPLFGYLPVPALCAALLALSACQGTAPPATPAPPPGNSSGARPVTAKTFSPARAGSRRIWRTVSGRRGSVRERWLPGPRAPGGRGELGVR